MKIILESDEEAWKTEITIGITSLWIDQKTNDRSKRRINLTAIEARDLIRALELAIPELEKNERNIFEITPSTQKTKNSKKYFMYESETGKLLKEFDSEEELKNFYIRGKLGIDTYAYDNEGNCIYED